MSLPKQPSPDLLQRRQTFTTRRALLSGILSLLAGEQLVRGKGGVLTVDLTQWQEIHFITKNGVKVVNMVDIVEGL